MYYEILLLLLLLLLLHYFTTLHKVKSLRNIKLNEKNIVSSELEGVEKP